MMWQNLFAEYPAWLRIPIVVAVVIVLSFVLADLVARLARTALLRLFRETPEMTFRSPVVRRPFRVIRGLVFLLVAATLGVSAFNLAGTETGFGLDARSVGAWFFGSGLRILLIVLVAYVAVKLASAGTLRLEREVTRVVDGGTEERLKRVRTLGRLGRNAVTVVIAGVAVLMVLQELRLDIMPILTGAGIVGLAVGFGAQTLVRDVISGFFLILEDQVRVGDVAVVNGTGGVVEAINLRTIVLRDLEGVVHTVPNGSIETLANRTRDYSYYVVDVGVAYKEDTDEVVSVLQEVGDELARDPAYAADILAPLEVLGVDDFADSQVTIKTRIKTLPLKQWTVGRELRRRVKKAFDARSIEIPFPHLSVYFGEGSRPFTFERRLPPKSTGAER
jgi:small conductance mechanosensitive channel